jgi:hypothetical protein
MVLSDPLERKATTAGPLGWSAVAPDDAGAVVELDG